MDFDALGAILTGGQSTRMGEDKALIELGGKPMAMWVAEAMRGAGLDVVTFGGLSRVDGLETVPDPPGTRGPLAGLQSALTYAAHRPVFVAAVDQPLLRTETVGGVMSIWTHDAVIPVDQDVPQVTCSVYRPTCLPALRQITAVNPEASIRDLLDYISVRYVEADEWQEWGEDGRSWRSIDTPDQLAAVRDWLAEN